MSSQHDREPLRRLFRVPMVTQVHEEREWIPECPSHSWRYIRPCSGHIVSPPTLPPGSPAIRVVKNPASSEYYAMISVRIGHPLVPPHPGHLPQKNTLREYAHPSLIFTDGSLGKFDFTRFPQLYQVGSPWRGFVSLPRPEGHSEASLEHRNVTEFFQFPGRPRYPILEGNWNFRLLESALDYRNSCESQLMEKLSLAIAKTLADQFRDTVPFFDPLEMRDCRRWSTFVDGRDALGRTLRYIAEIKAMARWLDELERQHPVVPPGSPPSPPAEPLSTRYSLLGVWTGTIPSQDDWSFLRISGIPLYSLFKLDSTHPLCKYYGRGWLDNDEQYRLDPVDIYVNPSGHSLTRYFPKPIIGNEMYPAPSSMPLPMPWMNIRDDSKFHNPGGWVRRSSAADPLLPFNSYIYQDATIDRSWPPNDFNWELANKRHRKTADKDRLEMRSIPLYPIGQEPAPPPVDRALHPILGVLPAYREPGNRVTYYVEKSEDGYFWAERLSSTYRKKNKGWDDDYEYRFSFDNGLLLVYSDHPWPDNDTLDGDECLDEDVQFRLTRRKYVRKSPSDNKVGKATPGILLAPPAVIRGIQNQPGTSSGSKHDRPSTSRFVPGTWYPDPYDFDSDGDSEDYAPRRRGPSQASKAPLPVAGRDEWSAMQSYARPPPAHDWTQFEVARKRALVPGEPPQASRQESSTAPNHGAAQQLGSSHTPKPPFHLPSPPQTGVILANAPADKRPIETTGDAMDIDTSPRSTKRPAVESVTLEAKQPPPTTTPSQTTPAHPPPLPINHGALDQSHGVQDEDVPMNDDQGTGPIVFMPTEAQYSFVTTTLAPELDTRNQPSEPLMSPGCEGGSTVLSSKVPASPPLPDDNREVESAMALSQVSPEVHPPSHPEPTWIQAYVQHRLLLRAYIHCRLFLPTGPPELHSNCIVGAVLDEHLLCYPVRVSNITSPFTIQDMLAAVEDHNWGTAIAVSAHDEPDGTISMDIGFRYVEDALLMWCRAGVRFDQRPWVFEAVTGVVGKVEILAVGHPSPRPLQDRLHRLLVCLELEGRLPAFLQDHRRMQLTREIIASALSSAGAAYPDGAPSIDLASVEYLARSDNKLEIAALQGRTSFSEIRAASHTEWIELRGDCWRQLSSGGDTSLLNTYGGTDSSLAAWVSARQASPPQDLPNRRPFMSKHQRVPIRPEGPTAPASAPDMNSRERGLAYRTMKRRAQGKYEAWNSTRIPLPNIPDRELIPPSSQPSRKFTRSKELHERGANVTIRQTKPRGTGLVTRFIQLWDWYDECLRSIDTARQELETHGKFSQDAPSNLEEDRMVIKAFEMALDDMVAAFAPTSRLIGVFGREYSELEAELANRSNDL